MKTLLKLITIVWLSILLQTCREDENPISTEKIQFSFDFKTDDAETAGGRSEVPNLKPGTFLQISIVAKTGETILDHAKIELLTSEDTYLTVPLTLAPGEYRITDFMLVNNYEQVEYATPRNGSPVANKTVTHPLPYSLTISENKTLNIPIEIVDVRNSEPEDFGYTSFYTAQASGTPFQITVHTGDNDRSSISAKAFIVKDNDTLHTYSLQSNINTIFCDGEPGSTYTLAVVKDGYTRYTREFNMIDLLKELDNKPLSVTLRPALTLIKLPDSTNISFDVYVRGKRSFTVDWGDGSTTSFTPDRHSILSHNYPRKGKYFICITGDFEDITKLYSRYGTSGFDQLNLMHLSGLEAFGLIAVEGPEFMDFSHNPKLSKVSFEDCNIKGFDISKNTKLSAIHLWGCTTLSTASIDTIINDIYNNVVSNNLKDGTFLLHNTSSPSSKSITKLKDLKRLYNWWTL